MTHLPGTREPIDTLLPEPDTAARDARNDGAAAEDELWLRQAVRRAVLADRIPARRADHLWGGPGSGRLCVICQQRVRKQEVEMELIFADAPGISFVLHVPCSAAWTLEYPSMAQRAVPE